MSSSNTIVSRNALQFTNDNKFAYAYSGTLTLASGAGAADTELLNFSTNSEYLVAKFQVSHTQSSGHDFYCDIRFNDVLIIEMKEDATEVEGYPYLWRLIIPPFTTVNVKIGANTTGYDYQCNVIGKVGMGPRVGNE